MELPKFVIGDNTDFPDDIFVIHLEYPRFFINLKDDSVEFLEDVFSNNKEPENNWNFYYFTIKDKEDKIIIKTFF